MTDAREELRRRAARRFRWSGLIIPLGVFVVLSAVQVVLLPRLPDPAATHWGVTGGPNGFGPAWTLPAMTLGIGGGLLVLFGVMALGGTPLNGVAAGKSFKLFGAVAWVEVGVIGVPMFGVSIAQVGLDDANDAPATGWLLLVGAGLGAVLAVVAWLVNFDVPRKQEDAAHTDAIRLAPNERAIWIRSVSLARVAIVVLGIAILITAGTALTTAILDIRIRGALTAATWITAAACVLVIALVLLSSTFEVRVDASGLTVRGPLGWPRKHVPRAAIRAVEVVHVSPMGDYGGWGWRYGVAGVGLGIVMRTGEAMRVTTTAGKKVTVTVEDAATGAALLRGMAPNLTAQGEGSAQPCG